MSRSQATVVALLFITALMVFALRLKPAEVQVQMQLVAQL